MDEPEPQQQLRDTPPDVHVHHRRVLPSNVEEARRQLQVMELLGVRTESP